MSEGNKVTSLTRESDLEQLIDFFKIKRDSVTVSNMRSSDLRIFNNIVSHIEALEIYIRNYGHTSGDSFHRSKRMFSKVGNFLDYPAEASESVLSGSPKPSKSAASQMFYECLADAGLELTKTHLSPASGYDDVMKALNQAAYRREPDEPAGPYTKLIHALRNEGKLPSEFETVGSILANRDNARRELGKLPNLGAKGPSMTILFSLLDRIQSPGKGIH